MKVRDRVRTPSPRNYSRWARIGPLCTVSAFFLNVALTALATHTAGLEYIVNFVRITLVLGLTLSGLATSLVGVRQTRNPLLDGRMSALAGIYAATGYLLLGLTTGLTFTLGTTATLP